MKNFLRIFLILMIFVLVGKVQTVTAGPLHRDFKVLRKVHKVAHSAMTKKAVSIIAKHPDITSIKQRLVSDTNGNTHSHMQFFSGDKNNKKFIVGVITNHSKSGRALDSKQVDETDSNKWFDDFKSKNTNNDTVVLDDTSQVELKKGHSIKDAVEKIKDIF